MPILVLSLNCTSASGTTLSITSPISITITCMCSIMEMVRRSGTRRGTADEQLRGKRRRFVAGLRTSRLEGLARG